MLRGERLPTEREKQCEKSMLCKLMRLCLMCLETAPTNQNTVTSQLGSCAYVRTLKSAHILHLIILMLTVEGDAEYSCNSS